LNWDKNRIASGKGVDSEDVERRRAINDDELVFVAERLNHVPEAVFSILHRNEFNGRADKVLVRWDQIEAVYLGVNRDTINRFAENQGLI
jgi:hypothetical protein